jgi:MoaA/NifB/PqqE/SkfB family radical SAM enzyme
VSLRRKDPSLAGLAVTYAKAGAESLILGQKPLFLTVFVTSHCPLGCGHCLCRAWRDGRNPGIAELGLDDYAALCRTLPAIPKLLLTGGEPFLRDDLGAIAACFGDLAGARQITVATSGWFPERTLRFASDLLERQRGSMLEIQLSIDGVGPAHDAVRGEGSWERLCATWAGLKDLQSRHPGLKTRFNFTFSEVTSAAFASTLRCVTSELCCDDMDMVLLRGEPADPAFGPPAEPGAYLEAADLLFSQALKAAGKRRLGRLLAARALVERRIIAEHLRGHQILRSCTAGRLSAVLREDGELLACEMRADSLGNVRDEGFDFRRVWTGVKAREARLRIRRDACFCTFETAVRSTATFRPPAAILADPHVLRAFQRAIAGRR